MAFWKEVDKVSVGLAFGWILAPENLIHPLQGYWGRWWANLISMKTQSSNWTLFSGLSIVPLTVRHND